MKQFLLAGCLCAAAFPAAAGDLDSLKVHRIDTVTVHSYRTPMLKGNVPNPMQVITPANIARSSATSLSEIVKLSTPAESADLQGLTGGVEFRGFAPKGMGTNTYTILLVDGIRMGTANAASTFLTGVQSIEMLKGPFSTLYGSGAMGGVINVITPETRGRVTGQATLSYGSWNTAAASVAAGGSLGRRFDFDAGFDWFKRSDDYATGSRNILRTSAYEKSVWDPHAYDTTYRNTTYDKMRGVLRLGWNVSDNWRLNLYNEVYGTADARSNGMLWGESQDDKRVERNFHRLDVTGRAGRHTLRFTPYVSFESRDIASVSSFWGDSQNDYGYNTYGFVAQDAMALCFGTLVAGVDNFSERFSSTRALPDGTPQPPYQPDYMNSQTGAFAQLNFTLLDGHLTGVAGVRYDNILFRTFRTELIDGQGSSKRYNTVNPNFSFQCTAEGLRFHAGIGRAFLAPDAYKTTGTYTNFEIKYTGNPDLKPETSVTYEMGAGYATPNRALELDATLFFTDHDNLDVTKTDYATMTATYVNANKATMQGVELMACYDLGATLRKEFSWKFYVNYTRIFNSEVQTPDAVSERKYLSRTKAVFGTDFTGKRFMASLSARYVGRKIEDNFIVGYDPTTYARIPYVTPAGATVRPDLYLDNTLRMPDYLTLDASFCYRLSRHATLGIKAANLMDELYAERDGYYMPGRSFSASLAIKF